MTPLLFVVGTLKAGFPLHERALAGVGKLCDARSVQRFPLVIAGPWFAPMMLNEPGTGHRIFGELYAVEADRLARIDRLESVPSPGNMRLAVEVESCRSGSLHVAHVYMKSRSLAKPCHSGYLEIYDDHRFVPFERRPVSGQK